MILFFVFKGERKALSHNFLKFSIFIEIKIENNVRENHHETFFCCCFVLFCSLSSMVEKRMRTDTRGRMEGRKNT